MLLIKEKIEVKWVVPSIETSPSRETRTDFYKCYFDFKILKQPHSPIGEI
jgi:hypothetical protein